MGLQSALAELMQFGWPAPAVGGTNAHEVTHSVVTVESETVGLGVEKSSVIAHEAYHLRSIIVHIIGHTVVEVGIAHLLHIARTGLGRTVNRHIVLE